MLSFWQITLRSLRHHPLRSATSLIAIAIATSTLLSVQMLFSALDQQARVTSEARAGNSDLDVRTALGLGLNPENVQQITALGGVANSEPLYQKRISVYRKPGDPGEQANLAALNKPGEVAFRTLPLTAGSWPDSVDQIALDNSLRSSFGGKPLNIGDQLSLTTGLGPQGFKIVGFYGASSSAPSFVENAILVTTSSATSDFGLGLHTPLLALHLKAGASKTAVAASIAQLYTGQVSIVDPKSDSQQPLFQLRGLLGLIALLTATMAIVSTASGIHMTVMERRREVGLLRIAGAQRGDIYRLFLLEGACLALLGSGAGMLAGTGLGALLIWSQNLGLHVTPSVSPIQLLLALSFGLGAGLIGAAIAARPVINMPILEALRPSSPSRREPIRLGVIFFALIAAYIGSLVLVVQVQASELAIFVGIAAIAALAPLVIPAIGWLLVHASSGLRGESALLSTALRNSQRSALAVAGLSTSAAIVVAIAMVTAGTLEASSLWISKLFLGQVVITSPVTQPDSLVSAVQKDTGAANVIAVRQFAEPVSGYTMGIAATDMSAYHHFTNNLSFTQGDRVTALHLAENGEGVLVPAATATSLGWQLGQTVTLGSPPNQWSAQVAGILQHSFPAPDGSESLLVDKAAATTHFGELAGGFDFLQIVAGSASVAAIDADALRYGMQATTVSALQASAQSALLRDLGLLLALGALAIGLAGMAIVNTITINMAGLTAELTLLRAIGMQGRQAQALLLGQASVLILATLGVGVVGGLALFIPISQSSSTPTLVAAFAFPYQHLLLAGAVIAGLTLLIVWFQAHRATRSDVIFALHHE